MPLESPKSPVQHPRHRVSGFSIPGRLPCLLAVVLGLFAHSEALAQRLTELTISGNGPTVELSPAFDADRFSYTVATQDDQDSLNALEDLTVNGATVGGFTVTYDPAATVDPLPVGTTRITVTVTDDSDSTQKQDYRIAVTRPADTTLATLSLTFDGGAEAGYLDDEMLEPEFDSDTRRYEAIVTEDTTAVTVTVTATSPTVTAEDNDITWDRGPAGFSHTRSLGTGLNTITATVRDGTSTGTYTIRVTKTDLPGAPGNLTARARNVGREVDLSWSAPSRDGDADIDYYEVAQYDEFDVEDDNVDVDEDGQLTDEELATANRWGSVGDVLSHRVTGLYNGRIYHFRVRAHNENGSGSGSNDASATPAGPPLAPTNLAATEGNGRVELTWTAPSDPEPTDNKAATRNPISSYEYSQNGSWRGIPNSDASTTSYTVTGLNNGTTYQFRVRAKNRAGNGLPSEEVRAVPRSGVPGAPTGLTAQAGDEEVTLSWRAPGDNGGEPITGYQYKQEATSGGTDGTWTDTGGTGTTVTVPGLTNGTTYYFKVRAVNDLGCDEPADPGCGQESLEVSAEPFGKPVTLVDLTVAMSDEDSRVALTWSIDTDPNPPRRTDELSGFQYRRKAGGGYGGWMDIRNSDESTRTHVVRSLTNGTTYTFQVRAVNSSGGGLASNELSAVPSTTPGAPTLTATAGDKEVRLTWTPADDGGRRILRYECELRIGAGDYEDSCAGKSLGASATSLTLTDDDVLTDDDDRITNGRTYTFRVRAVNDRPVNADPENADGDWSNEATARPTDGSGTERTFTISATIDDKSWAKAGSPAKTILATVEVNPRYTAPTTTLWVDVDASEFDPGRPVVFRPTNSERDVSFTGTPSEPTGSSDHITIALFSSEADAGTPSSALAVTSVEVRPSGTPDPPTGLEATRGDGEVTLSWATPTDEDTRAIVVHDYDYRQRRQPGSYGRWTDFAGRELQSTTVTSNTVTGLTNGGTYAFQVRAVAVDGDGRIAGAESGSSAEVSVSLSGTTGGLSAPRNLAAAPGNGQVTLSWTAPASEGGAAISRYEYQQRAGTGAYGAWTPIPGGPSSRSYVVTGLTNGTRYFYRVRAVNSDGDGPPSAEESATPSLTVDTTLRALSLSTAAPAPVTLSPAFTPATLTYTAGVGSSVTQVTVTATPNKAGARATITPADASTTAAGHQVDLGVGTTAIRVSVADGTNAGVYTITVTRAGSVPAAPTGLTATADEDGEGTVALSWTPPTGGGAVDRYEYQQRAGTGAYGAWTPIPGSGPSTTSHTVTGLANDTAYTFRVRGVNSVGNSAASNEATATPPVRLVRAKSEQEVAAVIAAAMAVGFGDGMAFDVGEQIEIPGSALFNAAEGVSLSYTAVSSASTVASAGIIDSITVTVTAVTGGMADITITATATPPSGATINPQTSPREASITFPVEVGLEALALTLSGPADGTNLVEGGRAVDGTAGAVTVTVTANRPVTEAVTVTLMLDRAMSTSTATADDFEAEPIVIAAGGTTGSTRVTAVEDGMAEKMEELVLFGLAAENAGPVTGEVRLRLWDAAVPVLPVVAQLLLAGLLAVSGFRRYRRRR